MIAKLFAITALAAAVVAQTTNVTIDQVEQAFTAANIVPSGTFSTVLFQMYARLSASCLHSDPNIQPHGSVGCCVL